MQREESASYYGWVIVALSFVVLMASYGLLYSYSVFAPLLAENLSLSRAEVSVPFSACVITYSVTSLVSGRLTDLAGPRPVILTAGVLMALGYGVLSLAETAWPLFLGLSALFGLGMSGAYIPTSATLVRWFAAKRGFAVGLANLGGTVGMAAGAFAAAYLIETLGWRSALVALGLIGGGLVSLAAFGFRRDPGDTTVPRSPIAPEPQTSWTLPQARRTAAFWLFCAIYLMTWSVMFFPFVHFGAFAVDLGWGADGGVTFLTITGVGGIFGRLGIGWLSDRFGRKPGLYGFLGLQALSCLLFAGSTDAAVLYAAAALFGAGAGAGVALYPTIVSDLFGRDHVGAIAGFAFAFTCSGGALGPVAGGWMRDVTGTYAEAFLVGAAVNLLAIVCAFNLHQPQPPASAQHQSTKLTE